MKIQRRSSVSDAYENEMVVHRKGGGGSMWLESAQRVVLLPRVEAR